MLRDLGALFNPIRSPDASSMHLCGYAAVNLFIRMASAGDISYLRPDGAPATRRAGASGSRHLAFMHVTSFVVSSLNILMKITTSR
ncbi:MAG: hypothetical protein KatS3mg057_1680 [Herpetosiphonaceae bacterium]|nr:MAG: hypothetical protein KatS3mg057_1680 [Herpetosiphonaceae bacterium]